MAELDKFARSCDLIVLRQPEADGGAGTFRRAEHLLFDSGRPVLIVPYIQKEMPPVRRALVAWNGSREAARATFDALPFLMGADKVEILTVETASRTGGPSCRKGPTSRRRSPATVSMSSSRGTWRTVSRPAASSRTG